MGDYYEDATYSVRYVDETIFTASCDGDECYCKVDSHKGFEVTDLETNITTVCYTGGGAGNVPIEYNCCKNGYHGETLEECPEMNLDMIYDTCENVTYSEYTSKQNYWDTECSLYQYSTGQEVMYSNYCNEGNEDLATRDADGDGCLCTEFTADVFIIQDLNGDSNSQIIDVDVTTIWPG